MTVHYTNKAYKDLESLAQNDRRRVVEALDRFAEGGTGDVRALAGRWKGNFRLRVGNLRAILRVDQGIIVVRVLHRREAYR
ncbi:MAG: type II toxin-antitoxin system RelE/ParE family toxin [Spirochaetaceae bacterium]|nr:type II toxin-antitoxin system RelE/ParE family toxin [Spirochaetaceae bacterium]